MSASSDQSRSSQQGVATRAAGDLATSEEAAAAPWEGRLWSVSCALALLGAVLLGLSIWLPWVSVIGAPAFPPASANAPVVIYRFLLGPADIVSPLDLFGQSLLSVVGVLLLPFLWQHHSRIGNVLALAGYWVWGILVAVFVSVAGSYFHQGKLVHLVSGYTPGAINLVSTPEYQFGYWLHFAALGIMIIAAILLVVTLLPGAAWTRLKARENEGRLLARSRISGMGSLTLGLVIWAVGIYLFPWATVNCTATPFILGTCSGVPFSSTLRIGLINNAGAFDPLVSLYAVGLLLGIGAVLIFLASWSARITGGFYTWVALWLVAATGFALLGVAGVGPLVSHPATYGLAAGAWRGDDGIAASFLGVLIGWGALLYLVITAGLSQKDQKSGR